MYCYQCEETVKGEACTKTGVCGKSDEVADLQDQLIYMLKGLAVVNQKAREKIPEDSGLKAQILKFIKGNQKTKDEDLEEHINSRFMEESIFSTVTNVNFSNSYFKTKFRKHTDFVKD